mgnify:CR=1 FL=1
MGKIKASGSDEPQKKPAARGKPAAKKPTSKKAGASKGKKTETKRQWVRRTPDNPYTRPPRKYKPTGNPPGRPKTEYTDEEVQAVAEKFKVTPKRKNPSARGSWNPRYMAGKNTRAKLRQAGLDPLSIKEDPKTGKKTIAPLDPETGMGIKRPADLPIGEQMASPAHDHPWKKVVSVPAGDRRTPVSMARKMDEGQVTPKKFNFKVVGVSKNNWEIHLQDKYCPACDPSTGKATETPPSGLIA